MMDTENEYLFLDMADPNTVDQIGTEEQEPDPGLAQTKKGWGKTKIVYEEDHSLDIVHHEPFSNGLTPSLNVDRDLPSLVHRTLRSTPVTTGADVNNASDELDAFFNRKMKKEPECEIDYEDIDMEIASKDSSSESDSDSDFIGDSEDEVSSEEGKKTDGKNNRKAAPLKSGENDCASMTPKLRRTSARLGQIKRGSKIDTETNRKHTNILPSTSTRKSQKGFESNFKTTPTNVTNRRKELKKSGNSCTQKAQPNIKPRLVKQRNSVKLTLELPFRGDTCGQTLRTATCLRRHIAAKHKSFPCSFCSLLLDSTLDRTNHIVQFHLYACPICGATFGEMAHLEEHRLVRHGSVQQPQIHLTGCVPSRFEVRTLKKPVAKTRVDVDKTGNSTNNIAPIQALVKHVKEENCACAKAFASYAAAPASKLGLGQVTTRNKEELYLP